VCSEREKVEEASEVGCDDQRAGSPRRVGSNLNVGYECVFMRSAPTDRGEEIFAARSGTPDRVHRPHRSAYADAVQADPQATSG